jgi:ABC-2 type transport system permease protein
MSAAMAIAGRELRAYFVTPAGYVIIALFAIVTGLVFGLAVLGPGQLASLRSVFGIGTWMLAFVAPAITMRLFSEEFRLGTFESLMTSPVRDAEVVLGKFFGALTLLVVMMAPTLIYVLALEMHGRPDYGELACGYLGLLLAGCVYIASGMLASSLTSSQPVAFLVALFFWLTIGFAAKLLPTVLGDGASAVVFSLDPDLRLHDFTIGLLDTSNVVYFISLTAMFLLASTASLRGRRWR